ncbi:MAG: biotin synthase BioB [Verrucomicrobiota bacterium]
MNLAELQRIYNQPLFELIQQARNVYLEHWKVDQVQLCTLLSIKTGGCSEDCGYCSQSARHGGKLPAGKLLEKEEVLCKAREAAANGSTRFCMGAAWRGVRDGEARFEQVLDTIRGVAKLGMEVCVTLGQLTLKEAQKLKEAGVTSYNHNIDTSPDFYPEVTSSHTFQDRLDTIAAVQSVGMSVCCGGIIGMGESETDRLKMLEVLSHFNPPPESVPINCLIPQPGTPMEHRSGSIDIFELLRLIATTRIAFPKAKVRLSAGRSLLTREAQAFCFFAGANSLFYGDRLLTSDNAAVAEDDALLKAMNLKAQVPHQSMAVS